MRPSWPRTWRSCSTGWASTSWRPGAGLDILRRLEREGLTIGAVRGEMVRLREIIELGYDPRSLIRPRRDFNDKILRELENL